MILFKKHFCVPVRAPWCSLSSRISCLDVSVLSMFPVCMRNATHNQQRFASIVQGCDTRNSHDKTKQEAKHRKKRFSGSTVSSDFAQISNVVCLRGLMQETRGCRKSGATLGNLNLVCILVHELLLVAELYLVYQHYLEEALGMH